MAAISFNIVQNTISITLDPYCGGGTVNGQSIAPGATASVTGTANFNLIALSGSPAYPSNNWLVVSNVAGYDECWAIQLDFNNDGNGNCIVSGYVVYSNGQNEISGSKIVTELMDNATVVTITEKGAYSIPSGFSANGLTGSITITA